jgi:hypothetical protein
MGFNKRVLSRQSIKTRYQMDGYQGVYDYITKPDALYHNGCGDIINIITSDDSDIIKEEKLKEILYGKL